MADPVVVMTCQGPLLVVSDREDRCVLLQFRKLSVLLSRDQAMELAATIEIMVTDHG